MQKQQRIHVLTNFDAHDQTHDFVPTFCFNNLFVYPRVLLLARATSESGILFHEIRYRLSWRESEHVHSSEISHLRDDMIKLERARAIDRCETLQFSREISS